TSRGGLQRQDTQRADSPESPRASRDRESPCSSSRRRSGRACLPKADACWAARQTPRCWLPLHRALPVGPRWWLPRVTWRSRLISGVSGGLSACRFLHRPLGTLRDYTTSEGVKSNVIRLTQSFIETPVSVMRAISAGDALCSLEFFRKGRMARLDARLARWFKDAEIVDRTSPVIDQTREWLHGYFAGESADISHLQLEMRGAPFEIRVWDALRTIPAGTTTTYGAIARAIGSPDASRAVGMANGANPIAIIVPCHRVI